VNRELLRADTLARVFREANFATVFDIWSVLSQVSVFETEYAWRIPYGSVEPATAKDPALVWGVTLWNYFIDQHKRFAKSEGISRKGIARTHDLLVDLRGLSDLFDDAVRYTNTPVFNRYTGEFLSSYSDLIAADAHLLFTLRGNHDPFTLATVCVACHDTATDVIARFTAAFVHPKGNGTCPPDTRTLLDYLQKLTGYYDAQADFYTADYFRTQGKPGFAAHAYDTAQSKAGSFLKGVSGSLQVALQTVIEQVRQGILKLGTVTETVCPPPKVPAAHLPRIVGSDEIVKVRCPDAAETRANDSRLPGIESWRDQVRFDSMTDFEEGRKHQTDPVMFPPWMPAGDDMDFPTVGLSPATGSGGR
jgi:hypothetical protein